MTQPEIRYTRTSDGVSIAYWILGEGRSLVSMPTPPFSHIQAEWRWPAYRRMYERLADHQRLVRYDGRGTGMSDRSVTHFSLDSEVSDLEAVLGRLDVESCALLAATASGLTAIAYAARHPQRVSHLVLFGCWSRPMAHPPMLSALSLVDADWELFTETVAHFVMGWAAGDAAKRFAAHMRECVTPETCKAVVEAYNTYDVTDLLQTVTVPTLILHPTGTPTAHIQDAQDLAAGIPDSRLVVLEGSSPHIGFGVAFDPEDRAGYYAAIEDFLSDGGGKQAVSHYLPSGTAVILFADIADSTALTERLGDAAFRAKARELDTALRTVIHDHAGTPIEGKLLGDGVLAVFTSARQAIEAALACAKAGAEASLPLHLGLHAGESSAKTTTFTAVP